MVHILSIRKTADFSAVFCYLLIFPTIQIGAAMGAMLIGGKGVISFRDISSAFGATALDDVQEE